MPNLGHLPRVPDTDGVKQKNKHHETIFPLTENKEVQFKEPHLPSEFRKAVRGMVWIFSGIGQ